MNTIPVCALGVSMESDGNKQDISILEFFNQFCKNNREIWFLQLLLINFDGRTGISDLNWRCFTKTEQNKLSLAYKELAKHNMVYRIKPKVYLVNPKLITPYKNCIDTVWNEWITFTGNEP